MSLRRYVRAIPFNYTTYGQYQLGVTTGIIPATPLSSAEVFQFRWNPADTSLLACIREVEISAAVTTTMFAAGVPVSIFMTKATAWTAVGTGGAGITPAALHKMKTTMASTGLVANDARVMTTDATGLGAGTKTLEGNHIAHVVAGGPITGSLDGTFVKPGTKLFKADVANGDHPLVLASQEGFVIRAIAPATGTWRMSINVKWDETTSYPFGTSS